MSIVWENGTLTKQEDYFVTAKELRKISYEQSLKDFYRKLKNAAHKGDYSLKIPLVSVPKELIPKLTKDGFILTTYDDIVTISWEEL